MNTALSLIDFLPAPVRVVRTARLVWLVANEYPDLLVAGLVRALSGAMRVQHMNTQEHTIADIELLTASAFLGIDMVYVMTHVDDYSPAALKQFGQFLDRYNGPHCLLIIGAKTSLDSLDNRSSSMTIISVDAVITKKDCGAIMAFHNIPETPRIQHYIAMLSDHYAPLRYHIIAHFIRYAPVLTLSNKDFMPWIEAIIPHEESLFTLSQLLFQKNSKRFFMQWHRIEHRYGLSFWVAFWSDQMFHAALVVGHKGYGAPHEMRAMKLPFSFINYDWRMYTVDELKKAHAWLAKFDYGVKNGCSADQFNQFFIQFIFGSF